MKLSRENVMTTFRIGLIATSIGGGIGGFNYFMAKEDGIESDAEAKAAFEIKNPPVPAASPKLVEFTEEIAALYRQESSVKGETAATSFGNNKDAVALARTLDADTTARIKDIEGQIASIQGSSDYQAAIAPQNEYQQSLPGYDRLRANKKAELVRASSYDKFSLYEKILRGAALVGLAGFVAELPIWMQNRKSFPLPEKRPQPQTTGGK